MTLRRMLPFILLLGACRTSSEGKLQSVDFDPKQQLAEAKICAGMRGNGQRMPALFGGLAQIVEDKGIPSRVAGGSSASMASFFYESMAMNPAVWQCGAGPCSDRESRDRLSLMLKSIAGIGGAMLDLPEGQALTYFKDLSEKIKKDLRAITTVDPREARDQLQTLLKRHEVVKDLFNPELKSYLDSEASLAYRVSAVKETLTSLGAFEAKDEVIFYRPGLFNFKTVAQIQGHMASFYASYAPARQEDWDGFLTQCAADARSKSWSEISESCRSRFSNMLTAFYRAPAGKNRKDDPIGQVVGTYITTAVVLDAAAISRFNSTQKAFLNGSPQSIGRLFDDVRFGYWGQAKDLSEAAARSKSEPLNQNLHWQKYQALEAASWESALTTSPAEPGLAAVQPFKNGSKTALSYGGWSNLFPSQLLKEGAGCEEVYFITRIGETAFDGDITKLLGITPEEASRLYDMKNPESSVRQSIASSDQVICTDWDSVDAGGANGVENLFNEGFRKKAHSRANPSTLLGCY